MLGSLNQVELPKCTSCVDGKLVRKPFPKANRSGGLLEIIHSEICGPLNVRARDGSYNIVCNLYR